MSILLYTKSVCVIRNSDGVEEWGYRVNKNIFLLFIVEWEYTNSIVYILQESREWEWYIPIFGSIFSLLWPILFSSNRRELNNYYG